MKTSDTQNPLTVIVNVLRALAGRHNKGLWHTVYKHHCSNCVYLGTLVLPDGRASDLYHCMELGIRPTVTTRWSSRWHDYISGLIFAEPFEREDGTVRPALPTLAVAKRLAELRGLDCNGG